jgi:hypothetical protein
MQESVTRRPCKIQEAYAGFTWSKRAGSIAKGKVHHWQVTIKVGFSEVLQTQKTAFEINYSIVSNHRSSRIGAGGQ